MTYCLNPSCSAPQNFKNALLCQTCGTSLILHDRYQVLKPIGQGGFGRTFLAIDRSQQMKPQCVIKQLFPQQQFSQQQGTEIQAKASDLFRQEAQQLSVAGQYPSIPAFLDYFEQAGYQYLVQEFIEGQNLAEILATGQLFTESQVKDLLETMLETIDFLHHHRIIHRDIKPANIIQTNNGRFILVDLGAAKLATGTALAQTGTVIGSAEYVAPEQLRGKAIFASDLYSLGATCITLLTGISPFSLFDTSTGDWAWRDYLSVPVSDRLGKVLDRMLMGPTKQRYESAIKVLQDLESKKTALIQESSIDPWHLPETLVEIAEQPDEWRSAQLEIATSPVGGVVEKKGDRVDRKSLLPPSKSAKFIVVLMGGILMWPIGVMLLGNIIPLQIVSEVPAPIPPTEAPTSIPPIEKVQTSESITPMGEYNLSELIRPDHTRNITPYKTIRNLPSFSSIAIKGNQEILFWRKTSGRQFSVSSLDFDTGKISSFKLPGQYKQEYAGKEILEQVSLRGQFLTYLISTFDNGKHNSELKIWNIVNQQFIPVDTSEVSTGQGSYLYKNGIIQIFNGTSKPNVFKILANGDFLKSTLSLESREPVEETLGFSSDLKNIFSLQMDNPRKTKIRSLDINTGKEIYSFSPSEIGISVTSRPWFPGDPEMLTMSQDLNHPFLVFASNGGISEIGGPSYIKKLSKLNPYTRGTPGYKTVDLKQVGYHDASAFQVFDLEKKEVLYTFSRRNKIAKVAISPDGNTLMILEETLGGNSKLPAQKGDYTLTVWDMKTGRFLRETLLIKNNDYSEYMKMPESKRLNFRITPILEFTPDGKKVVLAFPSMSANGTPIPKGLESGIFIWNVNELRNP